MSYIAERLRQHDVEIARLHRQDALKLLPGKVVERDTSTRKIRLQIGSDPATGQAVLSPWVRVKSMSAGAFKIFVLPSLGESMYLESASGRIGPDSVAKHGTFDSENTHPAQEHNEMVIESGSSRIAIKDGRIVISAAGQTVQIDGSGVTVTGNVQTTGTLKNNSTDVGSTHVHGGIKPGGADTSTPH